MGSMTGADLSCSSMPEGVMQPLMVRLICRLNFVRGPPAPREWPASCMHKISGLENAQENRTQTGTEIVDSSMHRSRRLKHALNQQTEACIESVDSSMHRICSLKHEHNQ